MRKIFEKIKFILEKPKVVIVTGRGRKTAKEAIFQVLKPHFKLGKEILILESRLKEKNEREKLNFLIKNSPFLVLVVTHLGDIPYDKDFFAGPLQEIIEIRKISQQLPFFAHLILNFDDETVREIKDETNLKELTFGFQEGADFRATDIRLNKGTNFKINYKGNIVPIWLEKLFGKEHIYAALASAAVGTVFGLNLVEISQALRNYFSLPGKMRLIEGIKNSWILDDSESATVFSMLEAIEILGRISWPRRKIAVLGDVLGVGKYTIEAHEAIGEKVAKNVDLVFTFGQRAKFIAKSALEKGMHSDKIFHFEKIQEGKLILQEKIKEGDLILVDGSKEMAMSKIVEEIRKIW